MLLRRVVVCLDVDAGRVVKGRQFVGLRDVGDPVELAERYEAEGADEIVFLDISATANDRQTMWDVGSEPPSGFSSRSRSAAASATSRTWRARFARARTR